MACVLTAICTEASELDFCGRVVEVSARDYVHENAVEAAAAPRRRRQAKGEDGRQWLCKDDYGLVPDYLHKLRLDMATQAAQQQVGHKHTWSDQSCTHEVPFIMWQTQCPHTAAISVSSRMRINSDIVLCCCVSDYEAAASWAMLKLLFARTCLVHKRCSTSL